MINTKHQKLLQGLIELSGLSQKDYASKHEINEVKLSHWVTGYRNIQFCTLELFAFDDGYTINLKLEKI